MGSISAQLEQNCGIPPILHIQAAHETAPFKVAFLWPLMDMDMPVIENSGLFKQATRAGAKPQLEERSLFKKNGEINAC